MSYYDFNLYSKGGGEAGGGGGYPTTMRLCSTGQSQPQPDPKQPQAQTVQSGIPMSYPQQTRPNQLYQTRPRVNPQRPHLIGQPIQPSNIQYQPPGPMLLHSPYPGTVIIPHSTLQAQGRHGGSGGGGGSGGAPPPGPYYTTHTPSQQQIYAMQSHPPIPTFPQYPSHYMFSPIRNNSYGAPNSGPHPGVPPQPPPQQPPQQFVVDGSVGGSGNTGGGSVGSGGVMMPHPGGPPQPTQQPQKRRPNALPITHPDTGRNIIDDLLLENQSQPGDSSSSTTPQSVQNDTQYQVAAEFAAKVAAVAANEEVGRPGMNGPNTPPPASHSNPASSAVPIHPPSNNHPPPPATQRLPDPQPPQIQHQPTPLQSHPPVHHIPHHQPLQTPQQIPTVSANTNSPTVEIPRPKVPPTAHSPHRKATPVPSSVQPVLDPKKKEKKVTSIGSTLPPHREEPEECPRSSFADSIDIKNIQPVTIIAAPQLPPPQAQPVEPEANGEPEVPHPSVAPVSAPVQPNPKNQEKHETPSQPQHQHEQRGNKSGAKKAQGKKKQPLGRGKEKEGGSDMDAFTSAQPPAAPVPVQEAAPPSLPPTPAPASEPSVVAVPQAAEPPVIIATVPAPEPPASPSPPPPASAPVSQTTTTILPPSSDTNVDNEQDEGLEQDMDEDEEVDEESLLVAKKNEENAKVSQPSEIDENLVIENSVERSKPSLKYTYKEGMWSPVNPEGKKVYDRDFLLTLREDDLSTKRPDIEECDIIKTDSANNNNSISATNNNRRVLHGSSSMSTNRSDGFAPSFFRSSSSQRGNSYNKRGSQQGRPGGGGRSKGMYPSSQYRSDADEELHWASKGGGWKPERCKTPPKLTEEEIKTEHLYKRVRGILNKLTPQKFEKLMEQILGLPIDTHERLKGVVELVFDKAVDEPSFSRAYAQMCVNLSKLQIKSDGNEESPITSFKTILLNKCQHMFEKKKREEKGEEGKKSDDERIAELQKQIAAEDSKDKKKELQLILEEEERKIRVKYVGLARFIGELFKLQMLTPKIMHSCIKTLLEKIEEESLECLCKLLTTVGKDLEQATKSRDLDEYFAKMKRLSQKNAHSKVSSRVRFMLQDVIELRSKNWVPRRDENNPKTMEQIQQDAEREAVLETVLLQQSNTPRSKHNDRDDRRRMRGGGGNQNNTQDSDGWHTTAHKFRYPVEPAKLQHLKGMGDEPSGLSLGSYAQFSQWNSGSSAKRGAVEPLKRNEFINNKYAILGAEEKKMPPPMMRKATPSSSMEKERGVQGVHDALGLNRNQRSNPPSRDNSRVRSKPSPAAQPPTPEQEPPPPREQPMDPDVCTKKSNVLFDEWLNNKNVQESVDSIKDTFPDPMLFVKAVIDIVLEGKPAQRTAFGDLLAALIAQNVVSASDVSKELSEYIGAGDDLMIDLPLVWKYFADIMVPVFTKEAFTFGDLKVACAPCRTPHFSTTLAAIINQLIKTKGPGFIRTQWEASKVKFTDFIPEKDVDNFIKSNKCGFLIGEGEIEASEPALPMAEVENILYDFLVQDGEKVFDHVCEWVKANVGTKAQDVDFIRALTRAVIKACIKNEKIVPGSLNKHSTLIKKFVDADETRELACLSGIQHLIVVQMESPAGVLMEIFQTLYENGIISHEAFLKWKTSKNEEGKGVAIASLSSFFVSLSEQDESDDEST